MSKKRHWISAWWSWDSRNDDARSSHGRRHRSCTLEIRDRACQADPFYVGGTEVLAHARPVSPGAPGCCSVCERRASGASAPAGLGCPSSTQCNYLTKYCRHVLLHLINVVLCFRGKVMRDKRAKFVELAEARVAKAIKTIRLIGNLSNRNNYEFGSSDVSKIISALEAELRDLRLRFKSDPGKAAPTFKL